MSSEQDGAWHDRMYNNRALVPGHPAFLERWAEQSARARRQLACALDLAYGPTEAERLDVFPAPEPDAPVLVFLHGGYWRSLDKSEQSFVAPAFTRDGACVVIPNYALCPAVTIPDIVLQMVRALAWTWRNIARFGGDPGRITVAGHSAGGHLAALLLCCLWRQVGDDLPPGLVRSALSISGLHDLEPIRRTPFLQPVLQLTPRQVAQASPARLPVPAQGVLFTVVGKEESPEYLRQNQLIQAVWGGERVRVCEALSGLNHFSVLDALVQPNHRLHQLALDLLRA